MIIALDWDRTFTRDRMLWVSFVEQAECHGHEVLIVTQRSPSEPVEYPPCEVIYTNRGSKAQEMNARGIRVDIWIDDNPASILGLT